VFKIQISGFVRSKIFVSALTSSLIIFLKIKNLSAIISRFLSAANNFLSLRKKNAGIAQSLYFPSF
jgi:hypothetical protein